MHVTEIKNRKQSYTISINAKLKILVIGVSGSGKTTLAKGLSKKHKLENIELDELFWKPNWIQSEDDEFRDKIQNKLNKVESFVIYGNYNKVRDLTWGKCNVVIWLDYSRLVLMWRVIKRTIRRVITKETLWHDNIETFRKSFLDKESIILWSWNTYKLRKKQYNELAFRNDYDIEEFIIINNPSLAYKVLI